MLGRQLLDDLQVGDRVLVRVKGKNYTGRLKDGRPDMLFWKMGGMYWLRISIPGGYQADIATTEIEIIRRAGANE